MTKIVLAQELGGGWGHLLPLRSLAHEFIQCGCRVSLLCRDDVKAATVFQRMDVSIEKTPSWVIDKTGFSLNYAQNLWGNGYRDSRMLEAHFTWWTDRLQHLKPGFILSDYAPTALLAALSLGIPRGAFGTGFTLPPMVTPMPGLHPWIKTPTDVLSCSEETVLEAIRKLVPRLSSIAGIFEGAERFLEIFPEMDHFEFRPSENYAGPLLGALSGSEIIWPEGSGGRVFIYLSSINRCLDSLINHVKKRDFPTVAIISGLSESERKAMESPTLKLSDSFVDLHKAASQCDMAVTQGGIHTSAAMLLEGVRLLICPEQLEQTLLAYRLKQKGLCDFVSFFTEQDKVGERFDNVASSLDLGRKAADFSTKYAGYDSSETAKEMVKICLNRA
jgi:UDP:flavonoid glycosyltransferase YjiC (YdhE family)